MSKVAVRRRSSKKQSPRLSPAARLAQHIAALPTWKELAKRMGVKDENAARKIAARKWALHYGERATDELYLRSFAHGYTSGQFVPCRQDEEGRRAA